MSWHFVGDRPIYAQLVERIQLKILSGEYVPGQKLPAIREFSAEAAVNPNTLQRAFEELERRGLVYTQRTAGRFISEDPNLIAELRRQYAKEALRTFIAQMQSLGYGKVDIVALVREFVGEPIQNMDEEESE